VTVPLGAGKGQRGAVASRTLAGSKGSAKGDKGGKGAGKGGSGKGGRGAGVPTSDASPPSRCDPDVAAILSSYAGLEGVASAYFPSVDLAAFTKLEERDVRKMLGRTQPRGTTDKVMAAVRRARKDSGGMRRSEA